MNNTVKSIFIVLGTFLIGLVLGVLLTTTFFKRPPTPEKMEKRMKQFFYRNTDATDEQKVQIDEVLKNHKTDRRKMDEAYSKQHEALLAKVVEDMSGFLETSQIENLKKHVEKMKERHAKRRPEHRPGPPPHHR